MRKILMLATVVTLSVFTVGCAQKKVVELDPKTKGIGTEGSQTGTIVGSSTGRGSKNGTGWNDTTPTYDNVDPYGSGTYGNYTQDGGNNNTGYGQNNNYNGSANGMKTIYFGVDKYMISADNIPKIITTAKILKKNGRNVRVEGHCDASGTDEYNYALGLRRAKSAKEALINRGVKASNITMVSMGESTPECTTGFSSECFAKNRRVEFK
jgi:peptidoglycan-associated lipoprotein